MGLNYPRALLELLRLLKISVIFLGAAKGPVGFLSIP